MSTQVELYNTRHGEYYRLNSKFLFNIEEIPQAKNFYNLYDKHAPFKDKEVVKDFERVFLSYTSSKATLKPSDFNKLQKSIDNILALDGFKDIEYRHNNSRFKDSSNRLSEPRKDKLAMYRMMRQFMFNFEGWRNKDHKRVWNLYCQKGKTMEEIGKYYYRSHRTELANKPVSKVAIFYIIGEYKEIMKSWREKGFFDVSEDPMYSGFNTTGFYTFETEVIEEIDRERSEKKPRLKVVPPPPEDTILLDKIVDELINN